jgi:hypothetical protein
MSLHETYSGASGQDINLPKSEVFFSRNMSKAAQEDLSGIMGVKHVLGTYTYMGLPYMMGRSKMVTFSYIKDKMWKKINYWRGRALLKAGKDVMINLVLQYIPSYIMIVYLILETIINDIENTLNSFGGKVILIINGKRWLEWDRLATPKSDGGLDFHDFHAFNMDMVAKQAWNFVTRPDTLVTRI